MLAAYKPDQYREIGVRADYTKFPFPTTGHESAISLFLTRWHTEQSSLRLQLTHGSTREVGSFNQILFQWLFGFGPHSHLLQ